MRIVKFTHIILTCTSESTYGLEGEVGGRRQVAAVGGYGGGCSI